MRTSFNLSMASTGLAILVAAGLAAGHPAAAQVTVGGTDTGSFFPFGGDNSAATAPNITYVGEYQQIYSASSLAGITTIRQISFSSATPNSTSDLFGTNVPETVTYNFTIGLSNTTATPTSASTTFSANKGANFTTVFTGTVTANLTASNAYDLVIPLQSAFTFLPANGNLLLDVVLNSANAGVNGQTDSFQAGSSANTGTVAYQNGHTGVTFTPVSGLLTRFSAAPEPSPAIALGIGVVAAGLLVARKRRMTGEG